MKDLIIKDNYVKVPGRDGIYKHTITGKYQARKKVGTSNFKKSFNSIRDADSWFRLFNGKTENASSVQRSTTLEEVKSYMWEHHVCNLAQSTQDVWERRFEPLKKIQHYEMHKITPGVISSWLEKQIHYYRSDEYVNNSRGNAKRCNMDNELNMLTTIVNYYRECEFFEKEAAGYTNPIKKRHKELGIIRTKAKVHKAIGPDDALLFFSNVEPLYRYLFMFQYFTASRIAEAAGLQWSRVNFERRELLIMETCYWHQSNKHFVKLNPCPKNGEGRQVYITDELMEILKRMEAHRIEGCNFVFHNGGKPLNYSVIQKRAETARRRSDLPYTGTHIFRHGMATLAREVGGGLDAVIAITGHKDLKLADHYSKDTGKLQKEVSIKIGNYFKDKSARNLDLNGSDNVLQLKTFKKV